MNGQSTLREAGATATRQSKPWDAELLSSKESAGSALASARCFPFVWAAMLVLLGALLALAYGPLLVEFAQWQQKRPHYHASIFPLLAFFALLGWRATVAPSRVADVPSGRLTGSFLALSWLLLTAAVLLHSPLMACLSAIMLAGAACSEVGSRRQVTNLWGIWGLLWLVVPIPLGQDQVLIAKLQLWSSQLCSLGLDRLGVLHLMEGNKLSLAAGDLFVDEACSGIVSVLLVVSLASIYGVARNRPAAHVLLLAASGIGWATLLNAVRIGSIAVALDWYQLDWSTGWAHELVGAVTALLAIGATVATDQLLLALLAPIEIAYEATVAQPIGQGRLLARGWDWVVQLGPRSSEGIRHSPPATPLQPPNAWNSKRLAWGLVPFGLVAGLAWSFPTPQGPGNSPTTAEHGAVARALAMDATTLPRELATANMVRHQVLRRDARNQFGEYSAIYEYRAADGTTSLISCDFPFPAGWHELAVCYQGIGWELLRRDVNEAPSGGSYVESHFRLPDGGTSVVLYAAFTDEGCAIEPPSQTLADTIGRALARRQTDRARDRIFQVQVLVTSPGDGACSEQQIASARQMLVAAEARFRKQIVSPPPSRE